MKKKWIILIVVLLIVAVVLAIVFINLFKERDTKALASKLVEVTETGYLHKPSGSDKGSDEYVAIHNYLEHLETLKADFSGTTEEKQKEVSKITNYNDTLSAMNVVVSFFGREMLFANVSDAYTDNHRQVEQLFDSAQKSANAVKAFIEDLNGTIEESTFWSAQSWYNCRDNVENMIASTAQAIAKLTEIYQKSVPVATAGKGFLNNKFTDVIFAEMNSMLQNITTKTDSDDKLGKKFDQFVYAYLAKINEGILSEYVFNENLQDKVESLKSLQEEGPEAQLSSALYQEFVSGMLKASI